MVNFNNVRQEQQHQQRHPTWIVKNQGSFASIHVTLPPQTAVNCESDAVVSFSDGIQVRGVMSGGILASLARMFLTNESFFTTIVENTKHTTNANVMMAPSTPGGIVLHTITSSTPAVSASAMGDSDSLFLISGSYIASDTDVIIKSKMSSTKVMNSLLSGTGFCLLHAKGQGHIAFGAYGSVHKYILTPGEIRAVDNGHLVAWSDTMNYWMGMAATASSSTTSRRMFNSVTSGEGLMCFFEGPGVIYIQSHKVDSTDNAGASGGGNRNNRSAAGSGSFAFFVILLIIIIFVVVASQFSELGFNHNNDYQYGSQQRYNNNQNYRYKREL